MPIDGFRNKALKRFYTDGDPRGLPMDQIEKIADILTALQEAQEPSDVGLFPGWRLHSLKGARRGMWSITVTANWRIVFRFEDGRVSDIDYIDYH